MSFSNCDGANGNLNDTAFNEDTANTADGINGAGPTPGIGLNSFHGPWLERIDVGLARSFPIKESMALQFEAQAFNLFNHRFITSVNTSAYTYISGGTAATSTAPACLSANPCS